MARWLEYLGEKENALSTYEEVRKVGNELDRITASHALAFQKKREKQYKQALDIWRDVAVHGNLLQRVEANIECAKLLEHQFKDVPAALYYTEKTFQEIKTIEAEKLSSKSLENLEKRLERLKRKQH